MKLFFWPSVDALEQYNSGLAFALAESKTQAINLILDHYKENHDTDPDRIRRLQSELEDSNPIISEGPFAHSERGSA